MKISYQPHGICPRRIDIEVEDDIVQNVQFIGGCNGNTKGLSAMVVGQPAEEVIRRLQGIRCGMRPTSCPDQLAEALTEALEQI